MHSQAKLVKLIKLVKPTLFRLLGEVIIVVIIKLPPTELDLKWKSNFTTFEFWIFQRGYRRAGGPKASPPVRLCAYAMQATIEVEIS